MEQVRAININNKQYNVAQAPAIQQKKLMLLLGGGIAFKSATSGVETIDTNVLIGTLLSLPEATFDEVSNIVMYKTVESGGTTIVDIHSFQGGMISFFKLVAEAVAFNLDDFFTYLDAANAASRATVIKPKS